MKALEIKNLNKKYKDFCLKDVSFEIESGTIMGIVGANGAGKSTIINCILGITKFEGDIKAFGQNIDNEIKQDIGFVIDNAFLSKQINALQVNKIYKNIYKNWDSDKFFGYIEKFEIPTNKKFDTFSKGMKMKFKIAIALSSCPKLLILDEPTSGLDPVVRSEILDILLEFVENENNSVLISSHITGDLEKVADYITYIDNGEIIFTEEKYELFENFGILKCSDDEIVNFREYVVKVKKEKYSTNALIKNVEDFKAKYPGFSVDKADIESIMVFFKRGEDYESLNA